MATIHWRVIQWFRRTWRIGKRRGDYPWRTGPNNKKGRIWKSIKWIEIEKKTHGLDNIPTELLQALDEETKHTLYCLISNIYTTGKIPDDFKKSIMLMLSKKIKLTKCEECRTLSILTHTAKILTKSFWDE